VNDTVRNSMAVGTSIATVPHEHKNKEGGRAERCEANGPVVSHRSPVADRVVRLGKPA
jgi:hypothetical protein